MSRLRNKSFTLSLMLAASLPALLTTAALAQSLGSGQVGGGAGGGGTLTNIAPADGSLTFTPNPITATGTISVNRANANTWTAVQSFSDGDLSLLGASSGNSIIKAPATGGGTATLPAGNGTLVYAGGAVTSITGTANQITASASTGAVTLSLPATVSLPGTTNTVQTILTIGQGGATNYALMSLSGGSSSGYGPYLAFQRGGVTKGLLGTDSIVVGGTSDNIDLQATAGLNLQTNGTTNGLTISTTQAVGIPVSLAIGGATIGTDALGVTGTSTLAAGTRIIQSGTTTTAASNALNNTTTGNITVVSTTGWPTTGTLKTSGGNTTEFISFSVVDSTTLNLTARGVYGSIAAVHAGTPTLAFALQINAASTSVIPIFSSWSDGQIGAAQNSTSTIGTGGIFSGTNFNTGFAINSGGQPIVSVNGTAVGIFVGGGPQFSGNAISFNAGNTTLSSPTSASFQFGPADVDTAPVAQTLRFQGPLVGGTSNVAGPNVTIIGTLGKGNANSGDIIIQTGGAVGASGTTIAAATTAVTIKGVTQQVVVAGQVNVSAMTQTSAAQSGTVCYNSGTGAVTYDATLGCLASLPELKDFHSPIRGALTILTKITPMWASWKPGTPEWRGGDHATQPVLNAREVAAVDARLTANGPDGKLRGVRYAEMTAFNIAVEKEMQAEIIALRTANTDLSARLAKLERRQ